MHTGASKPVKKGEPILIRGYSKIEENITQFTTAKQFKDANGKKDLLRGHKCSRPENVYYEGKYWLPNGSKLMVIYNHLQNNWQVYIPTLETFCGDQIPTACRIIKLIDTIAYLLASIQMKSQRSNTISQYSYNIPEHCPSPSVSDSDNDQTGEQNCPSPSVSDSGNIQRKKGGEEEEEEEQEKEEEEGKKKKQAVVLWNIDDDVDPKEVNQFCQQQTEKFFNKDFDKTTRVQKKYQTANKIVKREKQKALNSIKKNHRSPISFATKVIFCLKYENGKSNKDAWNWCKLNGFNVGKSHTSCHRWSQKGSQYWLKKLAESGINGQKFSFCMIIIIGRFNIYS